MSYFASLPTILTTDFNGNQVVATNIMARADIIPSLLNNPQLFYLYDMQETDTVEGIATRYYNDPYRYWFIMYGNQLMDPQWDLALSNMNFIAYLNDKYSAAANANNQTVLAYTQSTIYQYQIVISTTDSVTGTTTTNIYPTTSAIYANTPSSTITSYFSDGSSATVATSLQILTIYEYEDNVNEAKRSIQIIDKKYSTDLENALQSLMSP